jgi:ABC-type multidrug transport system fused ATPase/permease subunit
MAALSDADLRAILGDDYKAEIQSMDEEKQDEINVQNAIQSRLRTCENSRLSAVFLLTGGLVFVWAGWMISGFVLTIQVMLGIGACAVALFWFAYIFSVMRKLQQSVVATSVIASPV